MQMVMYRAHAEASARRHGLAGHVLNLPDGSVRIIAEGERAGLEKLVVDLRRGSLLSKVESVETIYGEPKGEARPFSIRYE